MELELTRLKHIADVRSFYFGKMLSGDFCGPFSSAFWINESIGLCCFQLMAYTPVLGIYLLASTVYCLAYMKSLAFEFFHSRIFWWRLIISAGIVSSNLIGVFVSSVMPLIHDAYIPGRKSEMTFYCITTVLWAVIFIHDALLGKSVRYSSRGPLLHLLLSVTYFYVCVGVFWSAYQQVGYPWRILSVSLRFLHLVLVLLHVSSKVPVFDTVEDPRMRRARVARENRRNVSNRSDLMLTAPNEHDIRSTDFSAAQGYKDTEDQASWISRALFCWMNNTVYSGYYGELGDVSSLPEIPRRLDSRILESRLPHRLNIGGNDCDETHKTEVWPFIKLLLRVFGREFMFLAIFKFVLSSVNIINPILLNRFIISLSTATVSIGTCSAWGCALILSTLLDAVLGSNYNYMVSTFEYRILVSVTGMVYRRILSVPVASLNSIGTGSLINHLTSDSERIVNLVRSVQEVWAMPLQFILAIILLYQQLGVSCFVGVMFLCVLLPMNRLFASQIGKFSKRLMHFKDIRIKVSLFFGNFR